METARFLKRLNRFSVGALTLLCQVDIPRVRQIGQHERLQFSLRYGTSSLANPFSRLAVQGVKYFGSPARVI